METNGHCFWKIMLVWNVKMIFCFVAGTLLDNDQVP